MREERERELVVSSTPSLILLQGSPDVSLIKKTMDEFERIKILGSMTGKDVEQYFAKLDKTDKERAKRERHAYRSHYGFWPPRLRSIPKEKIFPNQQRLF